MYTESFFITEKIGNNSLSYDERKKLGSSNQLYVPSLIRISNPEEIYLLDNNSQNENITFEDFGFDDKLSTCYGLKNFYELNSPLGKNLTGKTPKIYLFDNHNHALFFWYKARNNGEIQDKSILFHVDEHADYRDPGEYIFKPESLNLENIFEYTNFSDINVGNYIIAAEKEGLIQETIQLRSEKELLDYQQRSSQKDYKKTMSKASVIVNIDLDFFQPDLDFIDYELKKEVIYDILEYADVITVATSPFFIDQKLALNVFKDLFYK